MIEPKWLEQTYIVESGIDIDSGNIISSATTSDESINVRATTYRSFANANPSKVSYFQPILDRLDVGFSKFDYNTGGVIVEGKSDYYIMRYLLNAIGANPVIFPATGAGTMGALISLHRGWGLGVRVLVDGDEAGKKAKKKYEKEFLLGDGECKTLSQVDWNLTTVEDLLKDVDREPIALALAKPPSDLSKSDISRYCQEELAAGKKAKLSSDSSKAATALLNAIKSMER